MRATARVLEVTGERAQLACETGEGACSVCAGGRGCTLKRLAGRGSARLDVPRRDAGGVLLEPGARVRVEVDDGELLVAAARAYLPPLGGVLALPLLARAAWDAGEGGALAAALAGLLLGWAWARAWLRRAPPRFVVTVGDGRDA
jgi:positive regulator of sigma E activity